MDRVASIAERLYDGDHAECELQDLLSDAGIPINRLGWDNYDNSLEIYEADPAFRLSAEQQKVIHSAGFGKVYVNHSDKWETHYSFKAEDFAEVEGWRVSYPHRRGENEKGIWLEKDCPTWPREWFKSGYVTIKTDQQ